MLTPRRLAAALALPCLAVVGPASAGVIVVDASGGGDYTSLVLAVADAQDGDTLLVRPGDYYEFQSSPGIADRSLTIAAHGDGPVLTGPIGVALSTPGKRVVLRGLTIKAQTFTGAVGLYVGGGDVFVEACTVGGKDSHVLTGGIGGEGVTLTSGRLVLKDCAVQGGNGVDTFVPYTTNATQGGHGLRVLGGTVAIYGGEIRGGHGGNFVDDGFSSGAGANGGTGIVTSGDVLLAGCTVAGGDAGNGEIALPLPNFYEGGSAVSLTSFIELSLLGATLAPGSGGFDGLGQQGPPGQVVQGSGFGSIVAHPGPYRSLSLGALTPEGTALQLEYAGVPGDLLGLFLSLAPGAAPLPGKQGIWHLGTPLFGPFVLGTAGSPAGTLSLSIPVPELGLGPQAALLLHDQLFVKPASGPALLSSPATHLIVDDSL